MVLMPAFAVVLLLSAAADARCPGEQNDPCPYPVSVGSIMNLTGRLETSGQSDAAYRRDSVRAALATAGLQAVASIRTPQVESLSDYAIKFFVNFYVKAMDLLYAPSAGIFDAEFKQHIDLYVPNSERNSVVFAEYLVIVDRLYSKVIRQVEHALRDLLAFYPADYERLRMLPEVEAKIVDVLQNVLALTKSNVEAVPLRNRFLAGKLT